METSKNQSKTTCIAYSESRAYAREFQLEAFNEQLRPIIRKYLLNPYVLALAARMARPALAEIRTLGEPQPAYMGSRDHVNLYVELTPVYLTGLGVTFDYAMTAMKIEHTDSCMELIGWGIAIMTNLRKLLKNKVPRDKRYTLMVCPNYSENAMNMALGNKRMVVCLHCRLKDKGASPAD